MSSDDLPKVADKTPPQGDGLLKDKLVVEEEGAMAALVHDNDSGGGESDTDVSMRGDDFEDAQHDWFAPTGICQVFARCFDMFMARYAAYIVLTIIMMIPGGLVGAGAFYGVVYWEEDVAPTFGDWEDQIFMKSQLAITGLKLALAELILFLVFLPGEATMIGIGVKLYANINRGSLSNDVRASSQYICKMSMAAIVLFLASVALCFLFGLVEMLIGLISFDSILVIFLIAIYLGFFLGFFGLWAISLLVFPTIVVENWGPVDSIKRSWELTRERIFYVFVTNFLFSSARYILSDLIKGILEEQGDIGMVGFIFIYFFPALLFLPLQANIRVVLYMNIRAEVEGLNEKILLQDLSEDGRYLQAAGLLQDDFLQDDDIESKGDYVEAGE